MFFFLASLLSIGGCVCGFGLQEPDTCFILAMGRWIVEHRSLPLTDPFSWTYAIMPNGGPFVVYQWLTAVLFYLTVNSFGALGLLILGGLMLSIAFVVVPLRIMNFFSVGTRYILPIAILMAFAECAHINMRPEIFSYCLFSMFLEILIRSDQCDKINVRAVVLLASLMIIWCNLHTAFVLGLILLLLWCIFSRIDSKFFQLGKPNATAEISLPLCLAATLINPYGIKLWQYLPHLFFTPLNATINELQKISLTSLTKPAYYPYFLLCALFLTLLYYKLKSRGIKDVGLKFPVIGILGIVQGACARRMLTFAALSLLPSIAVLLKDTATDRGQYELGLEKLLKTGRMRQAVICIATILAGILLTSIAVPAQIPESCAGFRAPIRAVTCLDKHPQTGRLLNDPHFGDVMMWRMNTCPPLFIDSRYDIYDFKLLGLYWDMVLCRNNWREKLQQLNIDWMILPPRVMLIQTLRKDPKWEIIYDEEDATALRKRKPEAEGINLN